jgi:hypothetical protein
MGFYGAVYVFCYALYTAPKIILPKAKGYSIVLKGPVEEVANYSKKICLSSGVTASIECPIPSFSPM